MNTWEKQPSENTKAFQRFCNYRDMGFDRSLRVLAKNLALSPSTLGELSKKYSWQSRVKDFDNFIERANQNNQNAIIRSMKNRQIGLAIRAQKAAEKGLERLIRLIEDAPENDAQLLSQIKPMGLSRLLDSGCRLERLNLDEPEQNIELTKSQNFDRLSVEECEELLKLHRKAEGKE